MARLPIVFATLPPPGSDYGSMPFLPRGLGRVGHVVRGPGGAIYLPRLDGWDERQVAPGGDDSLTGRIAWATVRDHPDILRAGAEIETILNDNGKGLWAGTLIGIRQNGSVADLAATGYGHDPEDAVRRWNFMDADYGQWSPRDADPYNLSNSNALSVNMDGHLQWTIDKGTNIPEDSSVAVAFACPGDDASAVEFTINYEGDASQADNYEVRVLTYDFPNLNAVVQIDYNVNGNQGVTKRYNFPNGPDMIALAVRRKTGTGTAATTDDFSVTLTNVKVFGTAQDADYSCSAMARDAGAYLGCDLSGVRDVPDPAVPFDLIAGTVADVLTHPAVLSDSVWTISGRRKRLRFGPWDDRVWQVTDPRAARQLYALLPYDSVAVSFQYSNSSITNTVYWNAPRPLTKSRQYPIALSDPVPSDDVPTSIAAAVGPYLRREDRSGGGGTLTEVLDPVGNVVSALNVEAGDCFRIGRVLIRVADVRRTPRGLDWSADEGLAVVDRRLAQRSRWASLGRPR